MNGVSTQVDLAEDLAPRPDVAHLVTEDGAPVDNLASGKQMRLLTEPLYASWHPGRKFLAAANVGIFNTIHEPAIVPDVFVSLDVEPHRDWWAKEHRSYFLWEFGKAPEVVIEIVSNREGGEAGRKKETYARLGIAYYAIYDPTQIIQSERLACFALHEGLYVPLRQSLLREVGLQLVEWEGEFEGRHDSWLRWAEAEGALIPTGTERADREKARADALAERLRELGVDPDSP